MASDLYPPFIGGAELQTQLLSRQLAKRGHEVHVATVWQHNLPALEQDAEQVTIHRFKALFTRVSWFSTTPTRRFHPPFPDPEMVWRLWRLIASWKPDVIHASGWIAHSCALALFGTKIPLLLSARDFAYTCAVRTLLHENTVCDGASFGKCVRCAAKNYGTVKGVGSAAALFAGKPLLRRQMRGLHSVSTFVARIMQQDLIAGSDESVAQAVIPGFFGNLTEEELPDGLPDRPFVLFVGSLTAGKGLFILLDAYRRLESPPPLVLIGSLWHDTPQEYPPGTVVYHNLPHGRVMAVWKRCLFGVSPSIWGEALAGVLREAQVTGKAMIATAVGGTSDVVQDGENGLLVAPGDADALARAMQTLIDAPALREQMEQNARARAPLYHSDVIVPRFETLYQEIASLRQQF